MDEDRQPRRLTTILAADALGFSRLTADNEEETLRTLKAHRAVIDHLIARHEGRIFNTAGDSVLAEFSSAVEAVRCAIAIQEELRVRNAEMQENRRMDFRIGINVGDVLVDGNNLYGDGVNIAARLEHIATAGSICISGSVFALVKNRISYVFEDIGPQTVKNIPEPVSAYRLTPSTITKREVRKTNTVSWHLPLAAAVCLIIVIGVVYWAGRAPSLSTQIPSTELTPNTSPASAPPRLDTAALQRMQPYVGNAVEGISTVTGKPFAMTLKAGGVAEVKLEHATSGFSVDQGSWWIEPNGRFCVHYARFASGNRVCRELVVENGVVVAHTWDHRSNPWVIRK